MSNLAALTRNIRHVECRGRLRIFGAVACLLIILAELVDHLGAATLHRKQTEARVIGDLSKYL